MAHSGGLKAPPLRREWNQHHKETLAYLEISQSTTFRPKPHHTDGANTIADETNNNFAEDYVFHSLAGSSCAVDDSGGYANGPGGESNTLSNFATRP